MCYLLPKSAKFILTNECRDRMLSSAIHFAIGFFGYPFEGQYQQSITIEHPGVSSQPPLPLFSLLISVIIDQQHIDTR